MGANLSCLEERIGLLASWMHAAKHLVVFTGAGISTESGLHDFRGPDGIWTRREKGLPTPSQDFASAKPNAGHLAIVELQSLGKLAFLISQNVDNLHLRSGIRPELLAELHGNLTKVRCTGCEFRMDRMEGEDICPLCGGRLVSTVVNFGDPLPARDLAEAYFHSRRSDLFIVCGSSLVVYPAADMPRVALDAGARLVIINQGETPLDRAAHLRFYERIGEVFPRAVARLKELMAGKAG
ncbi:MAG: NAD-dependent protein deacylase [Dehalococcoidales bacterium]|nr:NAD-dependent protein deacylase [Dehalococcoidales bacterium]